MRSVTESVYSLESSLVQSNDDIIKNQDALMSQNTMMISLIIVGIVITFWFKRRRTKWM